MKISFVPSKRLLVDNFVFRLHYRWTVVILLACSSVITCRLVLGNSFSCEAVGGIPQKQLVETQCYSDPVYSVPSELLLGTKKTALVDPKVLGYRRYQDYYPWVNLFLIVQALIFFLPHLIWKSYESGFFTRLVSDLNLAQNDESKRGQELCYLAKYVLATQGKHKLYTAVYSLCEALNYVISLSQTLWIVHFFDVTGVPDFLPFHITTWWSFRQFYFPPIGICNFVLHGAQHQPKCLLPLNKLYMYIFLFVHAWFIFMAIMSGLALIYRIVTLAHSPRVTAMHWAAPLVDRDSVKTLCKSLSYSDWFFLTRFMRVMSDVDFAQMVARIEEVSTFKGCGDDSLRDNNGSLLSQGNTKELDNSVETSPV